MADRHEVDGIVSVPIVAGRRAGIRYETKTQMDWTAAENRTTLLAMQLAIHDFAGHLGDRTELETYAQRAIQKYPELNGEPESILRRMIFSLYRGGVVVPTLSDLPRAFINGSLTEDREKVVGAYKNISKFDIAAIIPSNRVFVKQRGGKLKEIPDFKSRSRHGLSLLILLANATRTLSLRQIYEALTQYGIRGKLFSHQRDPWDSFRNCLEQATEKIGLPIDTIVGAQKAPSLDDWEITPLVNNCLVICGSPSVLESPIVISAAPKHTQRRADS